MRMNGGNICSRPAWLHCWPHCGQSGDDGGRRWQALLFFCGTLFPVLGFFNLYTFRYSFAANHYQYLASAGIIALASAGALSMLDRLGLRPAGKLLSGVLLAGLAILTWRQSHQYVDSETLYRATIRNDPSSWMAHNNLSAVLLDSNTEEAMALAQEALRLKPEYAEARNNLGYALQKLGRLEEARAQYLEALRVKPTYPQAHNNLGYVLQQLGRPEEAVPQYLEALKLYPNYAEAHYNLGNVLQHAGRLEEAVAQYRETLRFTPGFTDARYNLGMALHRLGRPQEAVTEYQEALRLKPDFVEAHNNLGYALEALGRIEDAVIQYREALRLRPDFAPARENLANALKNRTTKTSK